MKTDEEILNDAKKLLLIQDLHEIDEKEKFHKKSLAKKGSVDTNHSNYEIMSVEKLEELKCTKMRNLYNKQTN